MIGGWVGGLVSSFSLFFSASLPSIATIFAEFQGLRLHSYRKKCKCQKDATTIIISLGNGAQTHLKKLKVPAFRHFGILEILKEGNWLGGYDIQWQIRPSAHWHEFYIWHICWCHCVASGLLDMGSFTDDG